MPCASARCPGSLVPCVMATMVPKLPFKESPFDSFVSQQLCSCQLMGIPPSLEDAKCQLRKRLVHYPIADKTNIVFPLNQLYIELI